MVSAVASAPQRRRSAQSHAAVLHAAAELAGRQGYASTPIEEIAAAAGVGKQTIYRWWPNKAALFIEVYGRLVPPDLVADDTGTLAGDLQALLSRLSHLYVNTPAGNILSGLIAEAQTARSLAEQLHDAYVVPRRAIVCSIFVRAAARREFDLPDDPDFASDLISGAVWFRLLLGTRHLDGKFKRRLVDTVLRGVSPSARDSSATQKATRDDRKVAR